MNYEYAIRAMTTDGTPILIPLGFGDDDIGKKLADYYVRPTPGVVPRSKDQGVDWSSYEVIRREVGEWEVYE